MKKIKKLELKKDVVTKLDHKNMNNLKGGLATVVNCSMGCTGGTCVTNCNCTATCAVCPSDFCTMADCPSVTCVTEIYPTTY